MLLCVSYAQVPLVHNRPKSLWRVLVDHPVPINCMFKEGGESLVGDVSEQPHIAPRDIASNI